MMHRHNPHDEVAGALWHLLLGSLYVVCVGFHLASAWIHWRDSREWPQHPEITQ